MAARFTRGLSAGDFFQGAERLLKNKAIVGLFDLDGVLVQSGAYQAACLRTIQIFLEWMRLEHLMPDDSVPGFFEINGIIREWDMIPINLALALEAVCSRIKPRPVFQNWRQTFEWLQSHKTPKIEVDYLSGIRSLLPYHRVGKPLTETILEVGREARGEGLFPTLSQQPLFEELFADSRDIHRSLTTRVFQNVILGDKVFEEAYSLPAEVTCPSFNVLYDHPLLEPSLSRTIKRLVAAGELHVAMMTARPCRPPELNERSEVGYAPEAEHVLKLVNLQEAPIMGYGSLTAAARRYSISPYHLLKPSGFHALAALALSWLELGWPALDWAAEIFLENRSPQRDLGGMPRCIELHVFEDSPSGILSAKKAAEMLQSAGYEIDLRLWGIVSDLAGETALQNSGAVIVKDINQALGRAFPDLLAG